MYRVVVALSYYGYGVFADGSRQYFASLVVRMVASDLRSSGSTEDLKVLRTRKLDKSSYGFRVADLLLCRFSLLWDSILDKLRSP